MKSDIAKLLKKSIEKFEKDYPEKSNLNEEKIESLIEIPSNSDLGDYAFPCFILSKIFKISPIDIAKQISEDISKTSKNFEIIQSQGPYVNFFVNRKMLAQNLLIKILDEKENFGKLNSLSKKGKIVIEFPSPNTNKPLHLGHLRNMAIGESVARILEFSNKEVARVSLYNDRGIHICQSMAAYQLYGKNKKPTKKNPGDKLVGDFYVMFNKKSKTNKKLELLSHKMLQKWEEGDKETIKLWKKMNDWAMIGFRDVYKKLGIKHDKDYFESEIYKKGKEIILEGLKKGIFEKNKEGAVIINLEKEGLGEKVVLRSDGTSIYITQDIYLASLKEKDFKPEESIYITANEQDYHFKVLFSILEKLGFNSKNLKHLSYGLVVLPEGRMKSREGTVVDANDLLERIKKLVVEKLKESKSKLNSEKSMNITKAAINYMLLKVDMKKNLIFNPKESINFEGDTGPYLIYSYARAKSILRKSKSKNKARNLSLTDLHEKEFELINSLSKFKETVEKSYSELNPSYIANYSYKLAKTFNDFYHSCPVIGAENEGFRLSLVEAFSIVLKSSLNLLGIETLEEM